MSIIVVDFGLFLSLESNILRNWDEFGNKMNDILAIINYFHYHHISRGIVKL